MDTLQFITKKFNLDLNQNSPIEIPNTNRETLAELFGELGFKVGAEIGTEQGMYAEVLCRFNPEVKLFCIDPWQTYQGYREHVTQTKLNDFYEITKNRLARYNFELIRKFSIDAAKDFPDNYLDFVYIDANHEYRHVVDDLSEWTPKVRKGGIVSGHDFIRRKNNDKQLMHVVHAVIGYTESYFIKPWFVMGRKNAKEGELRDKPRSWFWIKS